MNNDEYHITEEKYNQTEKIVIWKEKLGFQNSTN